MERGEHVDGRAFLREGTACARAQGQEAIDPDGGKVRALELTWERAW